MVKWYLLCKFILELAIRFLKNLNVMSLLGFGRKNQYRGFIRNYFGYIRNYLSSPIVIAFVYYSFVFFWLIDLPVGCIIWWYHFARGSRFRIREEICDFSKSFCKFLYITSQWITFSLKDIFNKCDQIRIHADLVTFIEEILNGKLHFSCNVQFSHLTDACSMQW